MGQWPIFFLFFVPSGTPPLILLLLLIDQASDLLKSVLCVCIRRVQSVPGRVRVVTSLQTEGCESCNIFMNQDGVSNDPKTLSRSFRLPTTY